MHEPSVPTSRAVRPAPRLRIDRGGPRGSDQAPGRGSLLKSFGVWDGAAARGARARPGRPAAQPERRSAPRHRVECRAWVGWKTWRRFPMHDALMIDLSRGGARIFLDAPPPSDRPVWVFLETPGRNAVVRARVKDFTLTAGGQCAARVAFDELCPYAVFEAAVCGLAPADPRARAPRAAAARPAAG